MPYFKDPKEPRSEATYLYGSFHPKNEFLVKKNAFHLKIRTRVVQPKPGFRPAFENKSLQVERGLTEKNRKRKFYIT